MSEYLKMADEFSLPVKEDTLEVYCRQHIGESFGSCEAYSAHAINSHDALVAQRDELLDAICGLIDFIEIDEIKIDSLALNIAREAIAKAKGGAA